MIPRSITAAIVGCIASLAAYTQTVKQPPAGKKGCSCAFSSINQVSFINGQAGNNIGIQTINGLRYKEWFAGIGVGLDYYRIRSIPVFLDIRRNILRRSNTPFVYIEGGMHFPFNEAKDKAREWFTVQDYEKGSFYEFGIGYSIPIKKRHAILLSAGYSQKNYTEKKYPVIFCGPCWGWPQRMDLEKFTYRLNRAVLKVGWQF